jgi:hypothetical protein
VNPAASQKVDDQTSVNPMEAADPAPKGAQPPEKGFKLAGTCHILHVFDIGYEIDLDRARERLNEAGKTRLRHKNPTQTSAQEQAFPLVFEVAAPAGLPSFSLAGRAVQPLADLTISVYPVGAVCIAWRLPFEDQLESLVRLSAQLYEDTQLEGASRRAAELVQQSLFNSIARPRFQPDFEDYFVFQVRELVSADGQRRPAEGWEPANRSEGRAQLARLLRAEEKELSSQEIDDALARPISYAPGEVAYVDWLAALLVGAEVHDELFVLELASVELLELRLLDRQLFRGIDEAYDILANQGRGLRILAPLGGDLARIARIQADEAVLHEGVDNALKLFGDDYLARLYRAAQDRFHFKEWDASIERKLDTLDSVHQKLSELASWRRSEVLEWIIIILIFVEIAMSLLERFG